MKEENDDCADFDELQDFWASNFDSEGPEIQFYLNIDVKQVDPSNLSHPLQETSQIIKIDLEPNQVQEYTLSFAPNEFVGRDNVIGFIQTTPESRNFLSIDNVNN